jgi:bacterial/archaeal transporter family protein
LDGEPLESTSQRAGNSLFPLTAICVCAGTIAFFLLFQKGGPLSAVPAILAGDAAIMAVAGILFFREPPSWQRLLGVGFAIIDLFLLRKWTSMFEFIL